METDQNFEKKDAIMIRMQEGCEALEPVRSLMSGTLGFEPIPGDSKRIHALVVVRPDEIIITSEVNPVNLADVKFRWRWDHTNFEYFPRGWWRPRLKKCTLLPWSRKHSLEHYGHTGYWTFSWFGIEFVWLKY